jgi:cyclopropane-fatty-acyl-phospholipid synthase
MFLLPTGRALGEAYVRGDLEIEGDLEAATQLALAWQRRFRSPVVLAQVAAHLYQLPADDSRQGASFGTRVPWPIAGRRHARARDAHAVRAHYDLGNAFYALWLDQRMVYSCGYFVTGVEDLDTAQVTKLDYLCQKLRLQPGESLLDIGRGWGGLIIHAVKHYGVTAIVVLYSCMITAMFQAMPCLIRLPASAWWSM